MLIPGVLLSQTTKMQFTVRDGIVLYSLDTLSNQTTKMPVDGYGFLIDFNYWGVHLPDGDLPRRENRTYLYWMEDPNTHELIQVIYYRDPQIILPKK